MLAISEEKIFQQNTDLETLGLLIPYLSKSTFLDIGAATGEFTKFFAHQGLKGVLFEPLITYSDLLTELAKKTQCQFLPYAIDRRERKAYFYEAYDKFGNKTEHFSSLHRLKNDTRVTHKKIAEVECRSLNYLMRESAIPQSIGIIKIDTEGNDLNILKGMGEIQTEILMCEFFMPNIYAGWELGHPLGLIKETKKLGLNNFIAIKRIGNVEIISLNDINFIDKQWGNLIFISDKIYDQAQLIIDNYINKKNQELTKNLLIKFSEIHSICEERLLIINSLEKKYNRLVNKLKKMKKWNLINILRDRFSQFINK